MLASTAPAQPTPLDRATQKLSTKSSSIELNTADSAGSVTAAEAMRALLLEAGFPAADFTLAGPNAASRTW